MIRILLVWFSGLLIVLPQLSWGVEKQAEVIHWWVSGGERRALGVVIESFEDLGYRWLDTPVENSFNAKTAALSRMFDGYPPTLVQWHAGRSLAELQEAGLLGEVDRVARSEQWPRLLPPALLRAIEYDGRIVAIPMTIHGSNWLWASRRILEKCGIERMPESMEEFFRAAEKVRKHGYIPLALGGQPWQERLLFIASIFSVGGRELYRKAMIEHLPDVLGGPEMVEVFRIFGRFRGLVDQASPNRSWSETTRLVIEEKAAFQFMGDWAKGEFFSAGQKFNEDFLCSPAPGTRGSYLLVSDVFAMTRLPDDRSREIQARLARLLMEPSIQERFNLLKGSIPPRMDVRRDRFDPCSRMAMDIVYAGSEAAMPGFNMANGGLLAASVMDVLSTYWDNPEMTPHEGAKGLRQAVTEAQLKR